MNISRRQLIRLVAVIGIAWIAGLMLLARWQRATGTSTEMGGPELIHYPGTEDIPEQTSPNIGFRKYWFELAEEYPSKSVFYFYQNELTSEGWQLLGDGQPRWKRYVSGDQGNDIFRALWASPDGLYQLELEMLSVAQLIKQDGEIVSEDREPGVKVYVTLRRAVIPHVLLKGRGGEPPRPGIEPADR